MSAFLLLLSSLELSDLPLLIHVCVGLVPKLEETQKNNKFGQNNVCVTVKRDKLHQPHLAGSSGQS